MCSFSSLCPSCSDSSIMFADEDTEDDNNEENKGPADDAGNQVDKLVSALLSRVQVSSR